MTYGQTEAIATRPTLIRSTLIMIIGFAVARLISLAQTFLIADVFGVGAEWDRFIAANQIPETIVMLIAGGALTTALIPMFGGLLARGDKESAWKLASHVLNTVFLVSAGVSILAFVFAPALIEQVVAPVFSGDAIAQTVDMMRILLITTLIFSVSGTSMGLLQSHNRFLAPALAPIMFDIGILFGAAVLVRPFGVYGIAYGTLIGAVLHLGIQLPALRQVRARWSAGFGWHDPAVRRVFALMLPRIVDVGVFTFSFTIAINLASRLGDGAISAFSWGWRLMQIPQTLLGTAMGIVIFPTLAALSELNDVEGKRRAMAALRRAAVHLDRHHSGGHRPNLDRQTADQPARRRCLRLGSDGSRLCCAAWVCAWHRRPFHP